MSDIAEITIRKVSNGWVVVCIGDGGTDEAIARGVDELCDVLREVLGEEAAEHLDTATEQLLAEYGMTPDQLEPERQPTTPPAVKTEGPIAVDERFECGFCNDGGEWPRAEYCGVGGCPFTPAEPGTQAQ